MKKSIAVLFAASILLLGGCTSSSIDQSSVDSSASNTLEKIKIAIVQPMDHPSLNLIRETIVSELDSLGLSNQVEIIYRNANGDSSVLPTIFSELIGNEVDLLVPIATGPAQTAAAATDSIPIVFSAVSNPIEAGLVAAFDQTTGNITGVSNSIAVEDIFVLASELTPEVKTFGFIYNTGEINSVTGIARAKAYCDQNGILYKEAGIAGVGDLQMAVQSLAGEVDAFFTPNDNSIASAMPIYLQVANEAGVPIYVGADSMVADGGLATVGIDYTVLGKQTAAMIVRLFSGESIAQNHVEQISEYAKMINTETAKGLGIEIPEKLLQEFVVVK